MLALLGQSDLFGCSLGQASRNVSFYTFPRGGNLGWPTAYSIGVARVVRVVRGKRLDPKNSNDVPCTVQDSIAIAQ